MEYTPRLMAVEGPPAESVETQPAAQAAETGESSSPPLTPEGGATPAVPAGDVKLPGGGGVYLLTDADDRPIQLAAAADLRRALSNRLAHQAPAADGQAAATSRRRANLGEIVRRIRWRTAYSQFEITYEYWRIARVLHPDSYLKQVGFGPAWFVHVDPNAAVPRFETGKVVGGPPGTDLGPFATQADAARFVQVIEDAFDLCRYYQELQQAPNGRPCAYFDMGRCPAPCNGSVPMADYRRTMAEALAFAVGERTAVIERWERQMREAAGQREFEVAAAFKQRMERAEGLDHRAFERVANLDRFNFLIVQRGGGTSRVKPFFVHRGRITPGEPVRLSKLDASIPEWIERTKGPASASGDAAPPQSALQELSEQIWLVSHFLLKREPTGLFLTANALPEPAVLADRIREAFGPRSKGAESEPESHIAPQVLPSPLRGEDRI